MAVFDLSEGPLRNLAHQFDETRLIRCVNLFGEQHTVLGEAALWWVYGDM